MKLQRKIEYNEKVCRTQDLGSYAQGQGHNTVRGQRSEVKLHLKSGLSNKVVKRNEKGCQTQELSSHIQGQGPNQVSEVKSFLCEYLKVAETNFIKLSKKVNHD